MKISTETYQYQNNSGQYERFASGYVQPDYALLVLGNWCYNKLFYYYWYVEIDTLNLLIALIKSPIDPTDINGQKTFFSKI